MSNHRFASFLTGEPTAVHGTSSSNNYTIQSSSSNTHSNSPASRHVKEVYAREWIHAKSACVAANESLAIITTQLLTSLEPNESIPVQEGFLTRKDELRDRKALTWSMLETVGVTPSQLERLREMTAPLQGRVPKVVLLGTLTRDGLPRSTASTTTRSSSPHKRSRE
jgi:hypothetical protein